MLWNSQWCGKASEKCKSCWNFAQWKAVGTSFTYMFEFLSPQDSTFARDHQGKAVYGTCLCFVHQAAYRPKTEHLLTGKAGYLLVQ